LLPTGRNNCRQHGTLIVADQVAIEVPRGPIVEALLEHDYGYSRSIQSNWIASATGTRLREQKTIAGMPWLQLIPCAPISTVFDVCDQSIRMSFAFVKIRHFSAVVFGEGDFRTPTENRSKPPALKRGDRLELGRLRGPVVRLLNHPRFILLQFEGSPGKSGRV
jgi:hypothetical protein